MANDQRGASRGGVIQGSFFKGRVSQPSVRPPANAAPSRPANSCINQHSAHLQRVVQAKLANPRSPNHQVRNAGPCRPAQAENCEAFQLRSERSNFRDGSGQPLPAAVRQKMETVFGASFADVRVHVGAQAASIGARAFTQGSNLYFARGQYNPNTLQGQRILGHELAHVVQQRAGRVRNPFGSGVAVVQNRSLEAEADRMGARAASLHVPVQPKMANSGQATMGRKTVPASPGRAPFASTVQRSVDSGAKPAPDPIAEAVIDRNVEGVKRDVATAMRKIRAQIHSEAEKAVEVSKALEAHGRDWFAYAPLRSWSHNLGQLLDRWEESWSLEATAGLLVDLCLALNRVIKDNELPASRSLMNQYMSASRQGKHGVNKESDFVKDLPEGAKVQAGVSASTAVVLRILHRLNVTTILEIEALMNILIRYWSDSGSSVGMRLKQLRGEFHTAAEVWASYTFYLETYQNLWMPRAKL